MFKFEIVKIDLQETGSFAPKNCTSDFSTPAHFQQLPFWASFKSLHGWKSLRFNVNATMPENADISLQFTLSVLVRSFKKIFSIAYIPMGPDCIIDILNGSKNSIMSNEDISVSVKNLHLQLCSELADALKPFLPSNILCVRMDPPIDFNTPEERSSFVINQGKLQKASTDIQPPDTAVLDITQTQDDLLANMKSKWRYNIKLSERKGVMIERCGSESIDIFYDLFKETAARDSIATHAKSYYKSLLELSEGLENKNDSKVILYIAFDSSNDQKRGEPLAGIIVLHVKGGESIYLYGASSNKKRNLMPAYLLQWTAIVDAKEFGCKTYDFYGISPTDDENHPMHGLWRFKTGFGGKNIHRLGSVDVPMSWLYYVYIKIEKFRAWYYKSFKKKITNR
jgi:lipid II:glycine glycyltransferase (peptidoglycan interpeptide bridge formation enzyme)